MKMSRKLSSQAKVIFHECIKNNELDQSTFRKVVNLLVKQKEKTLLVALKKHLEFYEKNRQLLIESPYPLEDSQTQGLKKDFEYVLNKKVDILTAENKDLISGIRITNGDFVWENTVVSNLNHLKGVITNE